MTHCDTVLALCKGKEIINKSCTNSTISIPFFLILRYPINCCNFAAEFEDRLHLGNKKKNKFYFLYCSRFALSLQPINI